MIAIVWLYRGLTDNYLDLVAEYCRRALDEAGLCLKRKNEAGVPEEPLSDFTAKLVDLLAVIQPFLENQPEDGPQLEPLLELNKALPAFEQDITHFAKDVAAQQGIWKTQKTDNGELKKAVERIAPLAERSRDLIKQSDLLNKLASQLVESVKCEVRSVKDNGKGITQIPSNFRLLTSNFSQTRALAVEQLKQVRYFWKQAHWLTERFPEAKLRDVEGLVKLVDRKEIEANDWSLTPGRYVGVAPEEVDENFEFEETLREIHVELEDLNTEAVTLAATIKRNFEELGI